MNTKYSLTLIMVACLAVILYVSGIFRTEKADTLEEKRILTNTEFNEEIVITTTPEELGLNSEITKKPYQSELEIINEQSLSEYFTNVALVECPFYEGGGAVYRDCLLTLLQKETTKATQEIVDAAKAKCEEHIENYLASERADGSNVVGEFNTICIAAYSSKL